MANQVKVLLVNGNVIQNSVSLKQGTTKIKATAGSRIVLADQDTGIAPENVTIKRVGKDLHVFMEGSEGREPDLIITDFYGNDVSLVGMAENGSYYNYIPTDG